MSDLDLDAIKARTEKVREWMHREWDVLPLLAREHFADVRELLAEVDRLRANRLPDGGEWLTEYGQFDVDFGETIFWERTHKEPSRSDDMKRRVWRGPAQPLSDASTIPDPDSDTQTTP